MLLLLNDSRYMIHGLSQKKKKGYFPHLDKGIWTLFSMLYVSSHFCRSYWWNMKQPLVVQSSSARYGNSRPQDLHRTVGCLLQRLSRCSRQPHLPSSVSPVVPTVLDPAQFWLSFPTCLFPSTHPEYTAQGDRRSLSLGFINYRRKRLGFWPLKCPSTEMSCI